MSFLISSFTSAGNGTYITTNSSGSYTIEIPPEFGGSFTLTAYGYANADPSYGSFGNILPTTYAGFTIMDLYWEDGNTYTTFVVSGDAHLLTPVLLANGVNQSLGAGSFAGGLTTFTSTGAKANQFSGGTTAVTIT